jgi:hypothetical protein
MGKTFSPFFTILFSVIVAPQRSDLKGGHIL